jgi:hypothetical protein
MPSPFTSKGIGLWCAAFLSLCVYSFLYKDNPFYKFAEHIFIGISAAYYMVLGFWTTLVPNLFGKLTPSLVAKVIPGLKGQEPDYFFIVPLVLGIMLLMRLSTRAGWISRWSLAFIVGTTAGLNFVRYLVSDFITQIKGSLVPLIVVNKGHFSLGETFSNMVMVAGVVTGLIYFFFSKEHKGTFGAASKVGICILMITFGAAFGYTVMGRIALLVGRVEFLFIDWLKLAE